MSDEKKPENLPLKEMTNADEKETNEKSPLQEHTEDGEAKTNGKEQGEENGDSAGNSKTKLILVALLAIVIICLFLAIVFITVYNSERNKWKGDPIERYTRLIPEPGHSRNTIIFRRGEGREGRGYDAKVRSMKHFLADYAPKNIISGKFNLSVCNNKGKNTRPSFGKVCFWDVAPITGLCPAEEEFGYPAGKPCIFLAFNKVRDLEGGPLSPDELQNSSMSSDGLTKYRPGLTYVFVECTGNTKLDEENMGPIRYAPREQEFPMGFFPYRGHPHYIPPFIAIKFDKPRQNIAIGITCRLYARNMNDSSETSPSVMPFNLLIT